MPQLCTSIKFRAVDQDGQALVGGLVYAYDAGTTTPRDTFTDFTLSTPNTNPVVLDSRGEADIWLDGATKLVLKDAAGVTISTVDDLRDLTQGQTFTDATLAGTLTVTAATVTWAANTSHTGNHTFQQNFTANNDVTLGTNPTDALNIATDAPNWEAASVTHNSAHIFASLALTSGAIVSGTAFTPTGSNLVNITTLAPDTVGSNYIRLGNFALVWGIGSINTTAINTLTSFYLTLPIASAFSSGLELAGGMIVGNVAVQNYVGTATAVLPDNKASFSFYCGADNANRIFTYWYAYQII